MRAVVNVATGSYVKGQERLTEWLTANKQADYFIWRDRLPAGCPPHSEVPYAFKAYALKSAIVGGAKTLLWCDASINPIRDLGPLWERIEEKGYWIGNNGWTNYEWTADSAYPDLFPNWTRATQELTDREFNKRIPHVVAGAFGISIDHPTGRAIFQEYFRLASETKAFCGPWINANYSELPKHLDVSSVVVANGRFAPCGPPDVRGHRHDQTALSVIAWRLGCELTNSPDILSYAGGETEKTFVVMDGAY